MIRIYDITNGQYKKLKIEYSSGSKATRYVSEAYKIVSRFTGLQPEFQAESLSSDLTVIRIKFENESYDEREEFFTNMLFELDTEKYEVA